MCYHKTSGCPLLRGHNNYDAGDLCCKISDIHLKVTSLVLQMAEQKVRKIGFKSVVLFKDQTLGIGSYGAVCKAKCDHLVCAAKIIHPTLFDPLAQLETAPQRQHRLPMRRFEQECDFLSSIRHPNIILYLGMDQDQESGLPVLLMELMDKSLTDFVESSSQPIPHLNCSQHLP